jgi:hypothetical protein
LKKVGVAVFVLAVSFAIVAIAPASALNGNSSITCEVSKWQTYFGESITVSGAINPLHAGVGVTLKYTPPVGTPFNRTVSSMGNGNYSDAMTPNLDGMWSVQASWSGDTDTQGNVSSYVKFLVSTISEATIKIGQNQTFSCVFQPAIDEYFMSNLESIMWDNNVTSPGGINFTAIDGTFFYDDPFHLGGGTITSYNMTYNIKILEGTPEGVYNATAYYNIYTKSKLWPYSTTLLFRYELRCRITASSEVIPEFPSVLILPMFMMATLIAMIIYGSKGAQKPSSHPLEYQSARYFSKWF